MSAIGTDGIAASTGASRWARFGLLRNVAPFDVRCMIALIALPAAWKVVSIDMSAIERLCARPPIFSFYPTAIFNFLSANDCRPYEVLPMQAWQIICAVALVLFAIYRTRLFLLASVVTLWFIDTSAYLYRGTLYTLDTPLALLTLLFFTPVNLRKASANNLEPSPLAKIAVIPPLTYVASFYILAGIAKFEFAWNWHEIVRVGNYYPVSYLWHTQVMPPIVDFFARHTSDLYLQRPIFDTASALIVYVEQFIWLLALFSLFFRVHAGLFAVAYHLIVALTTGIVFITWLFVPLAVTFPFSLAARRLFGRTGPQGAPQKAPAWLTSPWLLLALIGVPCFLAVLPSKGLPYPPFHNYLAFGWRYMTVAEFPTIYRMGWWDQNRGKLEAFPLGQAGFLDFRQTANMDSFVKVALTLGPDYAAPAGTNLRSMIEATRPIGSNGWLLGSLRAPQHLLGLAGSQEMQSINTFYLMRSKRFYKTEEGTYRVEWEACGEIERGGPDGASAIKKYDECRDTPN